MKKITVYILAAFLFTAIIPMQLKASSETTATSIQSTKKAESKEAGELLARLDVIETMDKSNLKSTDKKELLKEVLSIKTRLKELNGGVYLSVGAVIIIILLLIILL